MPIEYPKLRTEYGAIVTYADNPTAHIKTEFGFDVLQVARGRYAPRPHDFIGFEVSREVLDNAFYEIYALASQGRYRVEGLASRQYPSRRQQPDSRGDKNSLEAEGKGHCRRPAGHHPPKFLYNLSRSSYEKEWPRLPEARISPASWLGCSASFRKSVRSKQSGFKPPTPETARMFELSFNQTLELYRSLIPARPAGACNQRHEPGYGRRVAGQYTLADRRTRNWCRSSPAATSPKFPRRCAGTYWNFTARGHGHRRQRETGRLEQDPGCH